MAFLRRHWPVLLVILFPLLPLWRAVFLGEAIGPFDQIRQMAPWNGPAPDRPFDVLQADAVLQFYPWRDMVFEAWGKGQLPLWNPYQLAGTPLLANSQSAGFYPPHILMGVLHVPTHWAITLLAWYHLALAGLGVMALARRLGASREGGAIGGVLFSGSAFMLAWTALPSVISTCAWIPWVLAGVYGLFEERKTKNERRTGNDLTDPSDPRIPPLPNTSILQYFKPASGLAFATAMMLLAGHLQFAFYGLLAAGFVWVSLAVFALGDRSYRTNKTYSILLPIVALALGAGMASPQLLPVLEYSKYSHRRNVPTEEGYKAYVAGAIAPYELVGLVYPTAVGLPNQFAPEQKPLSQYWPALVKPGANFAEGAIGIGPLALFGLLMFPWRSHAKRLWVPMALLGGLAFLMAIGTGLNKPFYFLIPGWSSTGSPGRMAVLFVMGACALVAIALFRNDRVNESWRGTARSLGIVAASLFLTFIGLRVLGGSLSPSVQAIPPEVLQALTKNASNALMGVVALAVALAALAAANVRNRSSEPSMIPHLSGVFLLTLALPFWMTQIPTSTPITPSDTGLAIAAPLNVRLAAINEPWALVVAAPATLPPNTASLLRTPDLAGYDSLLHRDTQQFLAYVDGQDPAPPANGNIQYIKPTADPKKLAEAGVGVVFSRRSLDWPDLKPVDLGNGLLRYDLPNGTRAAVDRPDGQVGVTLEDGYDHQALTADGPGLLVVKDRLMPGWTAWVNGMKVEWSAKSPVWKTPDGRDVHLWRAVDLSLSGSKVEFRYEPPGLRTGFWIFVPCALLTLAAGAIGWKYRRA